MCLCVCLCVWVGASVVLAALRLLSHRSKGGESRLPFQHLHSDDVLQLQLQQVLPVCGGIFLLL